MATTLRAELERCVFGEEWLAEYERGLIGDEAFPSPGCVVPGVEFAAVSLPGREGPNDLHDTFQVSANLLAMVIADTWSAGRSARALRSFIRSIVRDLCSTGRSPGDVLTRLNRTLAGTHLDDVLVTLYLGWLDLRTGLVLHANAGHPHPLRVTPDGEVRSFGAVTGPILGIRDVPVHEDGVATLEPGETAVLYSGGVIESGGMSRRFIGNRGLPEFLERHAAGPPATLCSAIARTLTPDPPVRRDLDATILAVRWEGPPAAH